MVPLWLPHDCPAVAPAGRLDTAPAIAPGTSLASLFATHPPLQVRLEHLAKVSQQLGQ